MNPNPMTNEEWAQITEGRPLKMGDNIYFSKVRKTNRGKPSVFISTLARNEQNIHIGLVYKVRMKGISTGEVYSTTLTFKPNNAFEDRDRWPMYAVIPDMDPMPQSGSKLYLRLEPFDAVEWFDSPKEEPMDYFGRY